MPKIKKIRAAALTSQSARHEPLGQAIQNDENRNKYASTRGLRRGRNDNDDGIDGSEFHLMDAKSSQKILKLSKEQRLEVEAEEEIQMQKNRKQGHSDMVVPDSDDEEEEEQELLNIEEEE